MYFKVMYITTSGMTFNESIEFDGSYDEFVTFIKNEITMHHWLTFPGKDGNLDVTVKTKCIESFEVVHVSENEDELNTPLQ